MSEQAPRSNSRLDNFEANKAAHERQVFEEALYAEAGTTDFSDMAHKRVEEAADYEAHLEQLATDNRSAYDRGLDRIENGEVESAYAREQVEAIAENEAFDARRATAEQSILDTIAATPALRRMQNMARDIAELRNRQVNADNADVLVERLKDKEDKLNDLLIAYSETEGANSAIIDYIIDGTDASAEAPVATHETTPAESTTTAQSSASAEGQASAETTSTPEDRPPVDTSWADADKARPEVDTSWANEEAPASADTAAEVPQRPDVDTSWVDGGEQAIVDVPERPPVDTSWLDQDSAPKQNFSWLRHPFLRTAELYQNRKSQRVEKGAESKRGGAAMTAVAIGAIGIVGAVTAWKLGAFHDLFGQHHAGGGAADPNNLPSGGGGTTTPEAPTPPEAPVTPASPVEFSTAARHVNVGEGWYETFQDMNIPQSEWAETLQKVGPKLHEHGWAYLMDDGQWGISRPGRLPKDMLELIQNNK